MLNSAILYGRVTDSVMSCNTCMNKRIARSSPIAPTSAVGTTSLDERAAYSIHPSPPVRYVRVLPYTSSSNVMTIPFCDSIAVVVPPPTYNTHWVNDRYSCASPPLTVTSKTPNPSPMSSWITYSSLSSSSS
uniref:Uncharacterized protein n=1 Tax=Lygus hesperus TaxID=30085 RepID=A0A146LFK0_LYGHE